MRRDTIHTPKHIGEKIADNVTAAVGSWPFIIIQSVLLTLWITLNSLAVFAWKWDPAPFILLNLCLSFQAAYTAPIIMMSQNRQAKKDRDRDDLESEEVALLVQMNKQQLQMLQEIRNNSKEEGNGIVH